MLKKLYIVQFMTKAFVLTATLFVLMATVLVSCADEGPGDLYADEETDMDFSVTAAWQPGRVLAGTRSAEVPAIKDFVTIDDTVPYSAYPNSIWMEVDNSSYTFTPDNPEPTTTEKAHPKHFIVSKGDFKKTGVTDDAPTHYLDYHNQFLINNYGDDTKVSPKPFYKKSEMKGFVINAFWPWKRKVDNTANPVVDFPATPTPFAIDADGKLTKPRHWTNADVSTFGTCDFMYDHIADAELERRIEGHHLKLKMKHAMAMLRLYFQVHADYGKVRKIVLRKVRIKKVGTTDVNYEFTINASQTIDNSLAEASRPGFLLTTAPQLYAYGYMKPEFEDDDLANVLGIEAETWRNTNAVANDTPITIECTYDIYENDIVAAALDNDLSTHCTRRNVTATNTTTLKMAFNNSSVDIKAGHYYDLKITINPDYLYVLAEHDNKHITIN